MFGAFQARALVIVADPGDAVAADAQALHDLFGLTLAEARLANALSGGHSLESAAVLLQIQPATARTQLKSVFRKMEVSRQQDLVRLLTSLTIISSAVEQR